MKKGKHMGIMRLFQTEGKEGESRQDQAGLAGTLDLELHKVER